MNEKSSDCQQAIERFIDSISELQKTAAANESRNIGQIVGLYRQIAEGRFDAMADYLCDDVIYEWPANESDLIFSGKVEGRDNVIAQVQQNFSEVCEQKPELLSAEIADNSLRMKMQEQGIATRCGTPYTARFEQAFQFDESGKVRHMSFHHDSDGVAPLVRNQKVDDA